MGSDFTHYTKLSRVKLPQLRRRWKSFVFIISFSTSEHTEGNYKKFGSDFNNRRVVRRSFAVGARGNKEKSNIVRQTSPPTSFGDIGTNRNGSSPHLGG